MDRADHQPLALERGSFRDRHGRVYRCGDRIIRGLSEPALENYRLLEATAFYPKYRDAKKIVDTRLLAANEVPEELQSQERWAGYLEHERLSFISYAYEWTFGMLKDAALLHLELLEAAIGEGLVIKDATPYNIQFRRARPVFIDIPSFEPLRSGSVWQGYKQFCEMFLFPLMVQAYKGTAFQPFMRARIDGIDVQTAGTLFGKCDWFRKGVFSHVWLQSKLHRKHGNTHRNVGLELKTAGFNEQLILANVRKIRKLIQRLSWQQDTEWGDYESFHNYSDEDRGRKEGFVRRHVEQLPPAVTWDIGCNTGRFAHIAGEHSGQVVAMDIDPLAVERLYQELKSRPDSPIEPMLQNVADPSPDWGWQNRERRDLTARSRPDLVLCLALIHHVVISANIPLPEFVAWLARITPNLIIEFVTRDDDKVQTLLRNKEDIYADYSETVLEQELARHYEIRDRLTLDSGNRTLYFCSVPS